MHRAAVKLFFPLIFLLLALAAPASLTPPPLPDLEFVAGSADFPAQLTWEDIESPETCPLAPVFAVLILPTDPDYGDIRVVVHVVPCDPKNRLYRVFLCRQPPLGLLTASDYNSLLSAIDAEARKMKKEGTWVARTDYSYWGMSKQEYLTADAKELLAYRRKIQS